MAFPLSLSTDVAEAQADDEGGTLIARKVGEAVQNTLGAVVTAMDIPLGGPGSAALGVVCVGWKVSEDWAVILSKACRPRVSRAAGR